MKHQRPKRLRRCQLSVPGSSEKMMAKAAALDLDYVFFDLEDAVAPSAKKEARGKIVEALNTLDFGRTVRCVRVNDTTTPYCYGDVIEVVTGAGPNLDLLMIPKVMDADDVLFFDKLLTQLEADLGLGKTIGIECLVEEVEAMMNIDRIAAATPRLEGLVFGMGDYSASQGVPVDMLADPAAYPGDIWHYQRQRLVIACKVNGIDPIDGPYPDFRNADGYRQECKRAMMLGCVGKWAIHPAQIEIAQEVFSPSQAEVDRARAMKKAYEDAQAQGLGAVQYEGAMIDVASLRIIQNVLDKADLIGM
jgi:citrate lyase subunit beta/citryl-CoA lyase